MDIRLAEARDIPAIYKIGYDNYSEEIVKSYGSIIDHQKAHNVIEHLVKNKSVFVMIIEREISGAMVGAIVQSGFDSEILYTSLFFFIKLEWRKFTKNFIDGVAEILKSTPATRFIVGNPEFNNGPEMDRFYSMMGFKKLETHYIREIKHA